MTKCKIKIPHDFDDYPCKICRGEEEEKSSDWFIVVVMISMLMFVLVVMTFILLDEPRFKSFITNPENWGKAMSDPLSR